MDDDDADDNRDKTRQDAHVITHHSEDSPLDVPCGGMNDQQEFETNGLDITTRTQN